ncbi:LTA synthase family protein [Bacillus yapensis]
MIMSEAFWDPTLFRNVNFSQDPLPFFHEIAKEHTSGYVSVPVFGGSTVNTEFEALTGMSTQFLPPGVIPYLTYVKKPLPALPNILRSYGYETTAIHSYHNWFYQRTNVLKYLGFDQFIPLEFMGNPTYGPIFMKDKTIVDEILQKLDSESDSNFIFAITTQNHGPYNSEEKPENSSIEVDLNGEQDFTIESENLLVNYSNNLLEIDSELNRLIRELETRKKDTILVYFGDHLPLLGDDYQVFREADYYGGDRTYEEYKKMYSTPFIIWDNFTENIEELNISSSMLAPLVLDRANLNGNALTDYLINQYKKNALTNIPRQDFWEEEHIKQNTLNDMKLLQYDILFGKMHLIKDKNSINVSKNYRLGYKDPKVTNVIKEKREGTSLLIIKGENFTPYSNVFVNGKKIDRQYGNEEEIVVVDPGENGVVEIVVKVTDVNDDILAESNLYTIE